MFAILKNPSALAESLIAGFRWQYPRGESNACLRLRRPSLYPLSYGGGAVQF